MTCLVWRLDEDRATTMFDRTGAGNNGSFIGSPTLKATGALVDPDTAVVAEALQGIITGIRVELAEAQ